MIHMFLSKTEGSRIRWILLLILMGLICLWGGIYDFSFALYGAVFGIGILILIKGRKELQIPGNITTIGLAMMLLGIVVSGMAARDKGMAWIGVVRMLVFVLFWILWSNLPEKIRRYIWNVIPDAAAMLTACAMVLYFFPAAKEYLFRAERLGGVFQYSNSYAMLLLISLILIFYRERRKRTDYIEIMILLFGILFCGSRSVMIFTMVTVFALFIQKKVNWQWLILMIGCIISIILIAQFYTELDLGRLLQISFQSSTLNGRFLYWQDAAAVLCKHPLGLGYMGYFFLQPQFQTGNYVTKYVHNDFLQFGLDGGWAALTALIVVVAANIFSKHTDRRNRLILVVMSLHALFDFDFQYCFLFCVLLMCMNTDSLKAYMLKKRTVLYLSGILTTVFTYFAIALGASYAGQQRLALKLYPYYTFALESLVLEEMDVDAAEKINLRNGMLASAHECAARIDLENQKYEDAYDQIGDMITCSGYESYYYNQAVYYLSICLDQAIRMDDLAAAQKILEFIQKMPEIISKKEEQASALAYRINDKPEIELEEEIENYINQLTGASIN